MEKINIKINNKEVETEFGTTILEAAQKAGIYIPTLCFLKKINEIASCRVCVVEIEGMRTLQAACVYPITRPISVFTNSERVRKQRKRVVELLLSNHNRECTQCIRNLNCELQNVSDNLGIRTLRAKGENRLPQIADNNTFITRDYSKCITCRRCESICSSVQKVNVYSAQYRGLDMVIAPAFMRDLAETNCITCGQCVISCPTGSLVEKEAIADVWKAIEDKDKFVIVQTAPSIQVTLGEIFNERIGTPVAGKMVAALKGLGFDKVFPTDTSADLTIMEEASELVERLKNTEDLPLFSSCCPAWVKYAEQFYPEFLPNLSTCKSPHEMLGAMIKSYYAKNEKIDPKKIVTVAVMPCTAKKYEASRPEMQVDGLRNVDYVITTRELGRMIRQAGLIWESLKDEDFDHPFSSASGAGTIFGATGGVMEAAVRTAYYFLNDKEMGMIDFKEVRGESGIKEAEVELMGKKIKVGVVHSTGNAKLILDRIKSGEKYDYIEFMACPGGCVGGGGQPILNGRDHRKLSLDYRHNRADSLYTIDQQNKLRSSHQNPEILKMYETFLKHPLSDVSKKLLHTDYSSRE